MKEYFCDYFSIESTPGTSVTKPTVTFRSIAEDGDVAMIMEVRYGAELAILIGKIIEAGDVFKNDGSSLELKKKLAVSVPLTQVQQELLEERKSDDKE